MCTTRGTDRADLLGLLDDAAALLRRAGALPLGGAVADAALTQVAQRLEALDRMCQGQKLAVIAEIDSRRAWRGQAASSTEDLLTRTLGMSFGEAKAQTHLATGLAALPQTATQLREGRLGVGQAAVTVKKAEELKANAEQADDPAADKTATELVARLDEFAASQGQTVDKQRLARQIDNLVHQEGGDVLAERERTAHRRRGLWFGEREGLPTMQAHLTVEGFALVKAALDALSRPDHAGDSRTPAQRNVDALVSLAERYLDNGKLPEVAAQRPHVILILGPESLHDVPGAPPAKLDGVGAISNGLARQICCDAEITAVSVDGKGQPLNVGRAERTATKPQRSALIARDQACVGCGAPITRCQVHHIRWWTYKGLTDLENLVLVCWNCHHHIHQEGWVVTRDNDGRYHAGPPGRVPGRPLSHTG